MHLQMIAIVATTASLLLAVPSTVRAAERAAFVSPPRGGAWSFLLDAPGAPCNETVMRNDCTFVANGDTKLLDSTADTVNEASTLAIGAKVSLSKTVIDHMDKVVVSYTLNKGVKPTTKDWIGVFCLDREDQTLPDGEYLDWKWTGGSATGSIEFGPFVNMRCSWQFRFFTQKSPQLYESIGTSPFARFKNGAKEPTQVHLSMTGNPFEMRVMWVSAPVEMPMVRFWKADEDEELSEMIALAEASTTYAASDMCHEPATKTSSHLFRDPGMIHDAVMEGLLPGQRYNYRVGAADDDAAWSEVFSFEVPPAPGFTYWDDDRTMSFFVYGDLGDWNIPAVGPPPSGRTQTTIDLMHQDMMTETAEHNYLAALHDGDISYAMGRTYLWDQFGAMTEPVAANLAYMVGIGNHEYCHTSGGEKDVTAPGNGFHPSWGNYGADSQGECGVPFLKRFHMPDNGLQSIYYSVEMGLVHHTMISSEHDYTTGSEMFKWLEADLASVDRSVTPWLFLHLHRPLYCSENYPSDYTVSLYLRKYLEPLLGKYRVDAVFSGHYHSLERTCPVFGEECLTETMDDGTVLAKAPVHIMVGSGGADVDNAGYLNKAWSVARQQEYGYGRVHVYNATHAQFEFKRNRDKVVSDSSWIISQHDWTV